MNPVLAVARGLRIHVGGRTDQVYAWCACGLLHRHLIDAESQAVEFTRRPRCRPSARYTVVVAETLPGVGRVGTT